jgi:hypothetical protein
MNRNQAQFQDRKMAKDSVRRYFEREGVENFNWEKFGLRIVKKELYHAFNRYSVQWDIFHKTYCVVNREGNVVLR